MKKIILFTMLLLAFGCAKDGEQGPQGEKGEKGEQGIPGANGSIILSGNNAPLATQGKDGDIFLNLETGDLYGPKANNSWGTPFNLKGEKGDPGVAGATILSGQEPPLTTIGKIGDFYINLKEMTIYGPKNSAGWGDPVSLRSDTENGVSVYVFKPNWNKNLVTVNNSGNWTFTTFSDEYIIPGDFKTTYNVGYVAASPGSSGLNINVSLNQWHEFIGDYTDKSYLFPIIAVGLDPLLQNVKVESKVVTANSLNSKYKFNLSGKSEYDAKDQFRTNTIWILLKSYKFKEIKSQSKIGNIDRFLRINRN